MFGLFKSSDKTAAESAQSDLSISYTRFEPDSSHRIMMEDSEPLTRFEPKPVPPRVTQSPVDAAPAPQPQPEPEARHQQQSYAQPQHQQQSHAQPQHRQQPLAQPQHQQHHAQVRQPATARTQQPVQRTAKPKARINENAHLHASNQIPLWVFQKALPQRFAEMPKEEDEFVFQ